MVEMLQFQTGQSEHQSMIFFCIKKIITVRWCKKVDLKVNYELHTPSPSWLSTGCIDCHVTASLQIWIPAPHSKFPTDVCHSRSTWVKITLRC